MWRALAFVGSERRVRFNVFCDVQQEIWLWSAGRWFQKAGKASMTPHADDDEMGTNRHWYTVHFHLQCKFTLKQWYHASQDIHRPLKSSQFGRHFIVNLMLLFVRLAVPRRCCRDRQDTFCRLLALTGWSRCGFSFYLIWHMWRALAFVGSERRCYYLFALLYHVVAILISKIYFVGSWL